MTDDLPSTDDVDEDEFLGGSLEDVPKIAADSKCRGKKTEGPPGEKVFAGYCGARAGKGTDDGPEDGRRCKHHGGNNSGENGQGAKEDNDNAVTHAAYAKNFVQDYLTDEEIERVSQAQDLLETPKGAQDHGRLMAAIAVEQFRRSGDERFLRRYESICDKFRITPPEEIHVDMDADHTFDAAEGVTAEFVTYSSEDDDVGE